MGSVRRRSAVWASWEGDGGQDFEGEEGVWVRGEGEEGVREGLRAALEVVPVLCVHLRLLSLGEFRLVLSALNAKLCRSRRWRARISQGLRAA